MNHTHLVSVVHNFRRKRSVIFQLDGGGRDGIHTLSPTTEKRISRDIYVLCVIEQIAQTKENECWRETRIIPFISNKGNNKQQQCAVTDDSADTKRNYFLYLKSSSTFICFFALQINPLHTDNTFVSSLMSFFSRFVHVFIFFSLMCFFGGLVALCTTLFD